MIWSFLWRAAIYVPTTGWLFTFIAGFIMGAFGVDRADMYVSGMVAKGLGFIVGAAAAYLHAKDAQVAQPA